MNKSNKKHSKSDKFQTQRTIVFKSFSIQPKTMKMVSVETGIDRANICRFISKWTDENRIEIVRKGFCKISNARAGFYSTKI